ncbi:MAG: sigma 54-interacting transcriptional regulator [Planctomycetota bacterium]
MLGGAKAAKVPVTWYCGREYLDGYRKELEKVCRVEFEDRGSNTALMVHRRHMDPEKHPAKLLVALAEEYVRERERKDSRYPEELPDDMPAEHQRWHKLVEAAARRYFDEGDSDALQKVIVNLSHDQRIGSREQELIEELVAERPVLLGSSPPIRELRETVKLVAPDTDPVLILGPTGSGKELVARMVHQASKRSKGPFIAINCSALAGDENMAAARLFGHKAGAFTGATADRDGAFVKAERGTLFLDEVAELPPQVQAMLLRAMEERRVTPVGSDEDVRVDARLVAATHRDLPQRVHAGEFREDLAFRFTLNLQVPSLAERKDDIPAIARGFARAFNGADPDAGMLDALTAYPWPGNVRQLRAVMKKLSLGFPMDKAMGEAAMWERGSEVTSGGASWLPCEADQVVKIDDYIRHVVELLNHNISRAAETLGMARSTLQDRLKRDE